MIFQILAKAYLCDICCKSETQKTQSPEELLTISAYTMSERFIET